MGSSASWGADKEDEITVCKHGAESRYFDECQCPGCKADREELADVRAFSSSVSSSLQDVLMKCDKARRSQLMERVKQFVGELRE